MAIQQEPSAAPGLVGSLMMLPPKARLVAGIVMALLGAGLTVALWGRGIVFGATIFCMVVGFFLAWSGYSGLERQARALAQLRSVEERRDEILQDMIDLKKAGGSPVRYLNEQGIQDAELRSVLLEEMKERMSGR